MKTNIKQNNVGTGNVPTQQTGSAMDALEEITLTSKAEAVTFFHRVKERLLDVNRWKEIAGGTMSDFVLTDAEGNPVQRIAIDGDHVRIDIPGPGLRTGGGYDWVRVEEIKLEVLNSEEILSMTVRPSDNPLNGKKVTAHFLTEAATSTFQVKRMGQIIYAEVHGRNELTNTDTESRLDNIRNTLVGWGAKAGFSHPQWKALVKGLLNLDHPYSA